MIGLAQSSLWRPATGLGLSLVGDFGGLIGGDITAALNRFFVAFIASSYGLELYIPPGNYTVTAALLLPQVSSETKALRIRGAGIGATVITFTPGVSGGFLFNSDTPASQFYHAEFIGITVIAGDAYADGAFGIRSMRHCGISRCSVNGFTKAGAIAIKIDSNHSSGATGNYLGDNDVTGNTNGLKLTSTIGNPNATKVVGGRYTAAGVGGKAVNIEAGDTVSLLGVTLFGSANDTTLLEISDDNCTVRDCRGEFAAALTGTIGAKCTSTAAKNYIGLSVGGAATRFVDEGTNNRFADPATGLEMVCIGTWAVTDVAANLTDSIVNLLGSGASNAQHRGVALKEFTVAGFACRLSAAPSAGTINVNAQKSTTTLFSSGAVSDQLFQVFKPPDDANTITTVSTLRFTIDTSADWAATTIDLTISAWVYI